MTPTEIFGERVGMKERHLDFLNYQKYLYENRREEISMEVVPSNQLGGGD